MQWLATLAPLLAGAIIGVVAQECWRYLRPPEELRLLRQLLHQTMPTATPHLLQAAQPRIDAWLAHYRRTLLRARLAHAACLAAFIAGLALLAAPRAHALAAAALMALSAGCALVAHRLRRRAAAALRGGPAHFPLHHGQG